MCGFRCKGGAVKVRASAGSVRIRIALMALGQISPSHWLRVVGLLVPLTVVSAGWDQTVARSPRNDPPKRVIHGPNYRPRMQPSWSMTNQAWCCTRSALTNRVILRL